MLLKDSLNHKYMIQMAASFSKGTVIKSTINLHFLCSHKDIHLSTYCSNHMMLH